MEDGPSKRLCQEVLIKLKKKGGKREKDPLQLRTGLERDNPLLPSRVAGPVELRTAAAFGAFGCLI